jgi:hypothetical protein
MSTPIEPTEDQLQIYSADVIAAFGDPQVVAYHTPNGGKRDYSVAKLLKRFGTLPGVADWTFITPGAIASYLELKKKGGRLSVEQKEFQRRVTALGCRYLVAYNLQEIDAALIELGVIKTKPGALAA